MIMDSFAISILLALYSTMDFKLNNEYEVKVQNITFNFRVFISISELCMNDIFF